jgi:hypothetical protein
MVVEAVAAQVAVATTAYSPPHPPFPELGLLRPVMVIAKQNHLIILEISGIFFLLFDI